MTNPKFPADRKRSYADVEVEAQKARRQMGFEPDEPLASMALFERLEILRTGTRLEIPTAYCVQPLVDGVEAESRYNQEQRLIEVVLTEKTYSELEADNCRARFSVAHEAGHVVQHHGELVRLSRIPKLTAALMRGKFANLRPFEDVEWQADAFSGAYLAPAIGLWKLEVARRLSVQEICRRYGMSAPAASKRLDIYFKHNLFGMN